MKHAALLIACLLTSHTMATTEPGAPGKAFPCNPQGYVRHWLVAGPQATLYTGPGGRGADVRRQVIEPTLAAPPREAALGAVATNGAPWRFYAPGENFFVDSSAFYHQLTKVDLLACTELRVPRAGTLPAKFWVSGVADFWVNDAFVGRFDARRLEGRDCRLPLKAGVNRLCVRLQGLGARDTHLMFGLQLLAESAGARVVLPGPAQVTADFFDAERWLQGVRTEGRAALVAAQPAPKAVTVKGSDGKTLKWPAGQTRCAVSPEAAFQVHVTLAVAGQKLARQLEIPANKPATGALTGTVEEQRRKIIEHLANPGKGSGDVMQLLARRLLKQAGSKDTDILTSTLRGIEARRDCSDFFLAGLLRLQLMGLATPEETAQIKRVALGFRYWMDEPGTDAMCFDSENHSLLFHGNQWLAGQLWPDELFSNSKRTGREQAALGRQRCQAWLAHVEQEGFREFLSSTYIPLTVAALLNVVDFAGDADLARRAAAQVDRVFTDLAAQAFDGVTVGPQGRVYRNVLYPQDSGTQALLAYATPAAAPAYNNWIVYLAASKNYRPPAGLARLMQQPVSKKYRHEDVELALHKTAGYLLASLQIPAVPAAATGKTRKPRGLQPGAPGYQQHLWHATLGRDCHVFVNHPGASFDLCESRPGYWYGNGSLPRLAQHAGQVLEIFDIPETHPIPFTHAYWPAEAFDRQEVRGHWAFGAKGAGFVALWCSSALTPHNAVLTGRELRAEGRRVAWLGLCSDAKTSGSFEAFVKTCEEQQPAFDEASRTLRLNGRPALAWKTP
jgi:hypothetical protein